VKISITLYCYSLTVTVLVC